MITEAVLCLQWGLNVQTIMFKAPLPERIYFLYAGTVAMSEENTLAKNVITNHGKYNLLEKNFVMIATVSLIVKRTKGKFIGARGEI